MGLSALSTAAGQLDTLAAAASAAAGARQAATGHQDPADRRVDVRRRPSRL